MKFDFKEFAIVAVLVALGFFINNFISPSLAQNGIVDPLASSLGISGIAVVVIALIVTLLKKKATQVAGLS